MSEANPVKMECICVQGCVFYEIDWVLERMMEIKERHGREWSCPRCDSPMLPARPWGSGCLVVRDERQCFLR